MSVRHGGSGVTESVDKVVRFNFDINDKHGDDYQKVSMVETMKVVAEEHGGTRKWVDKTRKWVKKGEVKEICEKKN